MQSEMRTFGMSIVMVSLLTAGHALSQSPGNEATSARTAWGHPDLQGVWDFATMTPLERPEGQASEFLSEEEAAAAEQAIEDRIANELEVGSVIPVGGRLEAGDTNAAGRYNEFWMERPSNVVEDRRTSLIIDPPDGRLPALTASGEVQRGDYWNDVPLDPPVRIRGSGTGADRPEDRGLSERCLVGFNAGPPMTPSLYNNNVQLFQTPDTVVIYNEMIHDARIVPLADRALPAETIKQWMGVSRGRWEGDTLVVETTHFNDLTGAFDPDVHTSYGSGLNVHLTERFTRVDEDTLNYEYTVDDPITFARPFTVLIPMQLTEDPMYGYACHEGNRGLEIILSGGRADDLAHERKGR